MLKDKMRWIYMADLLADEYRQCLLEGREVEGYREEMERILNLSPGQEKEEQAAGLIRKMEKAPIKAEYSYKEPTGWEGIQKVLPEGHGREYPVPKNAVYEKVKGAWYGRAAGCLLGIPVENWTRKKIADYLKDTNQAPLRDYINDTDRSELMEKYEIVREDPNTSYDRQMICWRNCVEGFPVDDDTNYSIMAIKLLERYGKDFRAMDAAEGWLLGFPAFHACTAERVAYRNLLNGLLPPGTGLYLNPFREWIGAQIRADVFGYVNPGKPGKAAGMAYEDAVVSHTKNGVYGERYIAALLSLCYVDELDMRQKVELALKEIPPESRLHDGITGICRMFGQGCTYEEMIDAVHRVYREENWFDWCYVVPNAMIVTAGVLAFGDDYDKAVTRTVLSGFDTDCNGATVGSVVGLHLGFGRLDGRWFEGLSEVRSSIHGYEKMKMEEVVDRLVELMK